jgi:hypothetical protein
MCELDPGQKVPIEVPAASHVALADGSGRRRPGRLRHASSAAAETMA